MSRRRTGQILLAVGLASLIFGSWAGAQYRAATARQVFFVNPFGLAVSPDGLVYVGIDRREVHAYQPDGRPFTAWTVAQDAGRMRIQVDSEDRIEVARENPGERLVYAQDGRLLEREPDAGAFARFGAERDRRAVGPSGAVFELREEGLVQTAPGQPTVVVHAPPPPLRWLGPRPIQRLAALLFIGTIGLLVGAVLTAMPTGPRDAAS